MTPPPLSQNYPCGSADELLDALRLTNPYFGLAPAPVTDIYWLFRGQGAAYPLIPTALRPTTEFLREKQWMRPPDNTHNNRVQLELGTLREFFWAADRRGLPLPEDSQTLRNSLSRGTGYIEKLRDSNISWPPDELLSLMALAQHHGLPTRLLDWSRNPRVSAYFAAREAAERFARSATPDDFEVWALDLSAFMVKFAIPSVATTLDASLFPVSAPAAGNANLFAQEGLFTLYRPTKAQWSEDEVGAPLESLLPLAWFTKARPSLLRFHLAASEAGKVLALLAHEGFDASRLFPNFDGNVRSLSDRRYWP